MKKIRNLINLNTNEINSDIILEQYKILVESAHKNSENRLQSVNFFIAVLSGLLVAVTAFFDNARMRPAIAAFGLLISVIALFTVYRYRQMNKVKFQLIHELEEQLPVRPFSTESDHTANFKSLNFTRLEMILFGIFAVGFLFLMLIKDTAPTS